MTERSLTRQEIARNGNGRPRGATGALEPSSRAERRPIAARRGIDREPIDEILFALRCLDLDYRASESNADGPWRARCPLCNSLAPDDKLPLTITRAGHIRCSYSCDPEQIAATLVSAAERGFDEGPARSESQTSWAPISLAAVLAGDHAPDLPSILRRTDGRCLLYPGRTHALHAEPEALKTWLALKACDELLVAAEPVLFLDFEDAPASIASRLLALGADRASLDELFVYIRPDEPLTNPSLQDLERALEAKPSLAVVDGVTEAFSCQGLNPLDNRDVATWLDVLPRRLVRAGAAVLLLDHVVKDREQRGRYAIGAQHKLAGVDVAYSMRVIEPFARGRVGLVAIKVEKDRPGEIRAFAADGQVALLRARSEAEGQVRIKLEPPERGDGGFRPTVLMERVSLAIEKGPGLSKTAVRAAAGKRAQWTDLALELLIAERYVEVRPEGQAMRHYSVRPYRQENDEPDPVRLSGPCPDGLSDTAVPDAVPVSLPVGDTDAGQDQADAARSGEPVPFAELAGGES